MNQKRMIKLSIAILATLIEAPTLASDIVSGTCGKTNGKPASAALTGTVQLSPLAPIGSIIGSEFTSDSVNTTPGATITPSSSNKPPYYAVFTISRPIVSGVTYNGASVYTTDYNGIGLAIWGDSYTSGPKLLLSNPTTAGTYTSPMHYAFIKTGTVTSTGATISVKPYTSMSLQCQNGSGATVTSPTMSTPDGNILLLGLVTPACAVTNTAITVPLGNIKRTIFSGVGSSSPAQSFSIPLSCIKSTKVSISIAPGASGAFNATTGIINLDPATTGVKATGVGIQLLYNNVAMPLNSVKSVGSVTAEGTFNVPLSARYYQTTSTITSGSANGTATFVLTYN